MKKPIFASLRLILFSMLFLCFFIPMHGQIDEKVYEVEEDSIQYYRAKHFYEMRRFADGSLPNIWDEFNKLKQQVDIRNTIPAANWVSLGPHTLDSLAGRMTCYAFNPLNSQTMLCGASSGGVWKTTNGGGSWIPITDNLPSIRISAIAINPLDTNHILIGTGFYQGNSFTLIPGIGLLESVDGGDTWLPNSLAFPFSDGVAVSRMIWDSANPSRIFVGTDIGFWVSDDMGQTWDFTLPGVITDIEIVKATPERLYASVHSTGIYRSDDHGANWTLLTNGLPTTDIHRINIAVSEGSPDFALASIVRPGTFDLKGLYKTSNGGDSWTQMPDPPAIHCLTNCLGWFVNVVAVSPVDTNVMLLGGIRLARTIDGGQNWQERDRLQTPVGGDKTGLVFLDMWEVAFDPEQPETVYSLNDGGIQKSTDNGFFWEKTCQGLNTAQFYVIASFPSDTNLIQGGIQDHGQHYLDNSGGNTIWKKWWFGDGCSVAYDPNNSNRAYGDNILGTHSRTNNMVGGELFRLNFDAGIIGTNSVPFHFVTVHHPTESNILYTANDTRVFKSTNGTSWTTVANISNVRKIAISPANPSTVYAATYNSSLWTFHVSFDDGQNWAQTASSPGWRVTDVEGDPNIHGTVYATRNSILPNTPHVYKSIDHGESWTAISNGLPDIPTWTIAINPYDSDVLYVGTDLGVFISENAGLSWNEYNDNLPPYYVMDMHYHPLDSTLRIGTLGRGVWKTKSIPDIINSSNSFEEEDQISIFPNPFSTSTTIEFSLATTKHIKLSILNILGQEVKLLVNEKMNAGSHQVSWDGRNAIGNKVSPGIYFVRLESGAYKTIRQVVLQ